jgi:hypothetical protein
MARKKPGEEDNHSKGAPSCKGNEDNSGKGRNVGAGGVIEITL